MLYTFLDAKRSDLIDRCKVKALRRPSGARVELQHGIPQFLDQLIRTLRIEASAEDGSDRLSGISGAWRSIRSDLGEAAALHGRELLHSGYSVDEVVHAYGDLCQAITELAYEQNVAINVDEFHTVNRCLDNAIADAVKEYAYGRKILADDKALAVNERYGSFIHELRNHIGTATLAFALVHDGRVTASGATGAIVERTHSAMASLIERSIIEARSGGASSVAENKLVSLSGFIADAYGAAALQAQIRGCQLIASEVDPTLAVDVDTVLLSGALMNLLGNAFKFTYHNTTVCLDAYATADRILISVSDHCGGIPVEVVDTMFLPFAQGGADHSGLGLGLSISRKYVEACHGTLTFRNMPGEGCVFTIDLPRRLLKPAAVAPAPV
jgi:hypothetical protein